MAQQELVLPLEDDQTAKIFSWKIRAGDPVLENQVIASYKVYQKDVETIGEEELIVPQSGYIQSILVREHIPIGPK